MASAAAASIAQPKAAARPINTSRSVFRDVGEEAPAAVGEAVTVNVAELVGALVSVSVQMGEPPATWAVKVALPLSQQLRAALSWPQQKLL
jgi:hypothetical protein